jgi:hypothetical protein
MRVRLMQLPIGVHLPIYDPTGESFKQLVQIRLQIHIMSYVKLNLGSAEMTACSACAGVTKMESVSA